MTQNQHTPVPKDWSGIASELQCLALRYRLLHKSLRDKNYQFLGTEDDASRIGLLRESARLNEALKSHATQSINFLLAVVHTKGYPTELRVGPTAAQAAYDLGAYAPGDCLKQLKSILALISQEHLKDEIPSEVKALWYDRVAIRTSGKQRYGSIWITTRDEPLTKALGTMEDIARADALRAEIGLGTLFESIMEMQREGVRTVFPHGYVRPAPV